MTEERFEKTYWVGIVINSILTVAILVNSVYLLIKFPGAPAYWVQLLITLACFYYVVTGYRKPHGNLLRYIIWCFAVFLIIEAMIASLLQDVLLTNLTMVIIGLVMYVSGRLNKIRQNRFLFILILLLIIADNVLRVIGSQKMMGTPTVPMILFFFNTTVLWIDIIFSYLLRYHMHKEAGLDD